MLGKISAELQTESTYKNRVPEKEVLNSESATSRPLPNARLIRWLGLDWTWGQ